MSIPASYLGIILIWATTPLAIKWSSEGTGFLFGVSARMLVGAAVCSLIMLLLSRKLPLHRQAWKTYLAVGLGIYTSMTCVYWGAQFIPSGLISVIFGLTPIVTGVLATVFLKEQGLTATRLFGIVFGFGGLVVIFGNGIQFNHQTNYGIAAVLLAMVFHSVSSVWVKSISSQLAALDVVSGGLLVSGGLFLLTWLVVDGHWPQQMTTQAVASTAYLAIFGSVLGFVMYYHVLKHIEVSRVALVTLITPVLALLLGQTLNNEIILPNVWFGTGFILFGMSIYQWGPGVIRRLSRQES